MLVPRSIRGLGDGIDLLGSDGYAIAPPSTITTCPKHHGTHATCGTTYTWTPRTRRLAPLPAWIPRHLDNQRHAARDLLDDSTRERPPAATTRRSTASCSMTVPTRHPSPANLRTNASAAASSVTATARSTSRVNRGSARTDTAKPPTSANGTDASCSATLMRSSATPSPVTAAVWC